MTYHLTPSPFVAGQKRVHFRIGADKEIALKTSLFDLLYNAALKFDATFNVIVFPLDLGKRCAGLIPHAPKRDTPLRPRLGVNRAPYRRKTMGFEDDLRRIDEHIADARPWCTGRKVW